MKIFTCIFIAALFLIGMIACDDENVQPQTAVSFKEAAVTANENDETLKVPLTLSVASEGYVWIYFKVKNEEGGEAGINYKVPSYIVLEPGSVRGNVEITLVDDPYPNDDRTFELEIEKVEGENVIMGADHLTCKVGIVDDDSKGHVTVGFQEAEMFVNEDAGFAEVPVIVKGILSDSLTFRVRAVNGTAVAGVVDEAGEFKNGDYHLVDSAVKIVQGEDWGTVKFLINDKKSMRPDRYYDVEITGVTGVNEADTTVAIRQNAKKCRVWIKKVVREVTFADSVMVVSEITKPFNLPIQLTAPVGEDIKVTFGIKEAGTAKEGAHFMIDSKVVTIKRGETTANAKITLIDDKLGNPDRYCEFEILSIDKNVNISETRRTVKLIIENDDSSIGFGNRNDYVWSNEKTLVPIVRSGLHEETVMIELALEPGTRAISGLSLLNKTVTINAGDSIAYATIIADKLQADVSAMDFGLKIVGIKGTGLVTNVILDENAASCDIQVIKSEVHIDRTGWEIIYFSTEEPSGEGAGNGVATCILDGNEDTFWHSKWAGGNDGPGPHVLIVDMKSQVTISQVDVYRRKGNSDTKKVVVDVSRDNENWVNIGFTESFSGNPALGVVKPNGMVVGRYLKLSVTNPANPTVMSLSEVYVNGKAVDEL